MKPTCETDKSGSKYWYLKGKLHREDGPACEWADGTKSWWLNGELHREDGPAIEWADGSKSWYLLDTPMEPFTPEQLPLLLLGLTDL